MIYPNYPCYLYCQWLLNSSYQRFSVSQTALINTISTAALAGSSVTTAQYNLFLYYTSPYYRTYEQWLAQQPATALPGSLDSLTTAWLASVTSPAAITTYAVDAFFKQLRADGNLALDYFFLFAQDNQANSRISIINPTLYSVTEHASPTWTSFRGYTGNASNMYLQANFNSSANGVNYTTNSGMFGVYARLLVAAGSKNVCGTNDNTYNEQLGLNNGGGVTYYSSNNGLFPSTPYSNTQGLFVCNRTASNSFSLVRNGVVLATNSGVATGLCSKNDTFLAYNNNGSIQDFDNNQIACSFKGSGSINQVTFNSAVNLLMTNIGAHY
jgi:hypothetical protein